MAQTSRQDLVPYEYSGPTLLAAQPADLVSNDNVDATKASWSVLWTHLESRLSLLHSTRLSWWEHWALLARYILPRRYRWLITANITQRGYPINQEIVDSTGTMAMRVCASGMTSGLCDPNSPWFKMKAGVQRGGIALPPDAKAWLEEVENRMYAVMAESNFYSSIGQLFEDLVVFGTAVMLIYEDEEDVIRCYNPCAGEYYVAASSQFRVESLFRKFTLTIAQIVEMFELENCPPDIQQMWVEKGAALETERIIAHAVEPNFPISHRGAPGGELLKGDFTWREVYWVWGQANNKPLSIRGFHDQPFVVPRWATVSNDAYGRSPAMDALPDVMQLQVMTKREAEAIEKHVRPPLLASASLKNQPSSILPGHVTYVENLGPSEGMRPIYEVMPDLQAMEKVKEQVQQRIGRAFFTDIFLMISQMEGVQPRNQLEIYERKGEKIQQLGPVIQRYQDEAAAPAIQRIFAIMQRRGLFPPMPASLSRLPLQIEYVSEMALAQRAAATGGIERFMATLGNMAAVFPEVKDNVDPDKWAAEYADLLNVTQRILTTPDQKKAIRDARAQQAQAQNAMAVGQNAVQGANVLSQTQVGGGQSALEAMLGTGSPQGAMQ